MAQKNALMLLFLALFLTGGWHWFEPAARKVAKGVEAYQKGAYDKALEAFVAAKGIAPESDLLRYNTAASLLRLKKDKEALEELSQIQEGNLLENAGFHYNKGNAFFNMQNYQQALDEYKKSLLIDPDDMQAKRNFELALQKIKEQQKNQKPDSQDQNKPDEQKQDEAQQKEDPHKDMMKYLNQNEREQQKKQHQKQAVLLGREKDW